MGETRDGGTEGRVGSGINFRVLGINFRALIFSMFFVKTKSTVRRIVLNDELVKVLFKIRNKKEKKSKKPYVTCKKNSSSISVSLLGLFRASGWVAFHFRVSGFFGLSKYQISGSGQVWVGL